MGFFAWDLARNLTVKCSLFCTKFILKHLYLAENSLYKKLLFLREPARGAGLWNCKFGTFCLVIFSSVFEWLTLKAPFRTVADILRYFLFQRK